MNISETYGLLKSDPDRLFSSEEASKLFAKSRAWADRHRWAGTGPNYIKIGRTPYYRGSDLLSYIEESAQ